MSEIPFKVKELLLHAAPHKAEERLLPDGRIVAQESPGKSLNPVLLTAILLGLSATLLSFTGIAQVSLEVPPVAYLLLSVSAIPVYMAWKHQRLDPMEILFPVLMLHVIYFGCRAIFLLNDTSYYYPILADFVDNIGQALLAASIGVTFLLGGYYCGAAERWIAPSNLLSRRFNLRKGLLGVLGLALLGLVCRAWIYHSGYYARFMAGQREAPSGYLMAVDFMGHASYYSLILGVSIAHLKETTASVRKAIWGLLVPVTFVMAAAGGSKNEVMLLLISILMARHYFGRPLSVGALTATMAVAVFGVFPLITVYRELSNNYPGAGIVNIAWLLPDALLGFVAESRPWDILVSLMSRMHGIDSLALVMNFTPDILPFQLGRTIVIAPIVAFVPTFAWPGKYDFVNSISNGVEFGSTYFGNSSNSSGVAITQLGELYMNFGWVGIPVGMFVIGFILRSTYVWFMRHGRNPAGFLVYAYAYSYLIFIEGWFGTTYSNLLKHIVITSLLFIFLSDPASKNRKEVA